MSDVRAAPVARELAAQTAGHEYQPRLRQLESAVRAIEAESGLWSPGLPDVLLEIGDLHARAGALTAARDSYDRARHVVRVNAGLHAISQVPILERLADVQARLRLWDDATDKQLQALELSRRFHGEQSLEFIAALERLAQWHMRMGKAGAARARLSESIDLIESMFGDRDARLMRPLTRYARSIRGTAGDEETPRPLPGELATPRPAAMGVGFLTNPQARASILYGRGEQGLRRVIDIAASLDPPDPCAAAQAHVEYGDWLLVFNRYHRALSQYDRASRLWDVGCDRRAPLAAPQALRVNLPSMANSAAAADPSLLRRGHIDLVFDVNARGRPLDVKVANADPDGVLNMAALQSMRDAVYRPRFEHGEAVATAGVVYHHRFSYRPRSREQQGGPPVAVPGE